MMYADALELPGSGVSFPGPLSQHDVVVNGWRVPFLHAQVHDGGRLSVVLDNRFGLELTVAEAERVVPFLADTIAVALGYDAHPTAEDEVLAPCAPHPKPRRVVTVAGLGACAEGP